MPIYHRLGDIPHKRHSIFRKEDGTLYAEELMGNRGFTGLASLLYHVRPPTAVQSVRHFRDLKREVDPEYQFGHRHFLTAQLPPVLSPTIDRVPLLFNRDVAIYSVQTQQSLPRSIGGTRSEGSENQNEQSEIPRSGKDDFFYRNSQGDEVIYVSEGEGVLESLMGELPFGRGDYLVIPRGILHRYRLTSHPVRFLVIESAGYVRTPKRYRSEHGQLMENSPYCERDIRRSEHLSVYDEKGEFRVLVKKENRLTEMILNHHPFDVVGWDGYYYPWALNIEDFEPRVGRFHLPPPTHQTFEGDGFVICSFCPCPYDFDPQAIPAPYNHSNVMSDEVIYYASSEFMSRKGIEYGSITLHPDGLPHGPHPGRAETSIGKTETNELTVMLDTFRPLCVSKEAVEIEDRNYYRSWLEKD